jgi:hypothetical protein
MVTPSFGTNRSGYEMGVQRFPVRVRVMWLIPLLPFGFVIILHFALQDGPAAASHASQPANPALWQGLAACLIPCLMICVLVWRAESMTL